VSSRTPGLHSKTLPQKKKIKKKENKFKNVVTQGQVPSSKEVLEFDGKDRLLALILLFRIFAAFVYGAYKGYLT
jgi:hypothetical protein